MNIHRFRRNYRLERLTTTGQVVLWQTATCTCGWKDGTEHEALEQARAAWEAHRLDVAKGTNA